MTNNITPGQDPLDFSDVPGGDSALDELFPNPETFGGADNGTSVAPPVQPKADEFFVKTYKTKEATEKGIEEKDALIAQMRNELREIKGADPITKKPVDTPPPVNYAQDRKRYFRDIVDAVRKATETGDEEAYAQVQQQFLFDQLGPAVPLFLENARTNAVNRVEETTPGIKEFLRSEDFARVKQTFPGLAEAIQNAENDFRFVASLPEMYQVAYLSSQGLKVPELLRSATSSTANAPGATPQPRPTLTNSTPAPPQAAAGVDLSTAEGRKAYIDAAVRRGIDNVPIR